MCFFCENPCDKGICLWTTYGYPFGLVPCALYLTFLCSTKNKKKRRERSRIEVRGRNYRPYVEERPYVLSWRNGVLWAESGPQLGILNDIILEPTAVQAGDGVGPSLDGTTSQDRNTRGERKRPSRWQAERFSNCPKVCSLSTRFSRNLSIRSSEQNSPWCWCCPWASWWKTHTLLGGSHGAHAYLRKRDHDIDSYLMPKQINSR